MSNIQLEETLDYSLVVQKSLVKDCENRTIYAIINKKYKVVEGEFQFLAAALDSLQKYQEAIDNFRAEHANKSILDLPPTPTIVLN